MDAASSRQQKPRGAGQAQAGTGQLPASGHRPHLGDPRTRASPGRRSHPTNSAGRKVIALFDRAAARDFVDVYARSRRFSKKVLLELAGEVDAGFEPTVFAEMLSQLPRYRDVDLELADVDVAALRAFFDQWVAELEGNSD